MLEQHRTVTSGSSRGKQRWTWAIALVLFGVGLSLAGTTAAEEGPDLVVGELSVEDEGVVAGEQVHADVVVENIGDAEANASDVLVRIDDGRTAEAEIGALGPGEQAYVNERWTGEAGEHTLTVIADVTDDVDEAHEENNEAATTYAVAPQPEPNLVPDGLSFSPYERPVDGDHIDVDVVVKNTADPDIGERYAEAATFVVEIREEGELVEKTRTDDELEPGEATSVDVGAWTMEAGERSLTVTVDVADEVAEADETDNERTFNYTVLAEPPEPNLVAHAPRVVTDATEMPIEGQWLDVEARVGHTGASVSEVNGQLAVDGDTVTDVEVGPLPRGFGTSAYAEDAWQAEAGQHTLGFTVDRGDAVDETDETDNHATRQITVLEKADPSVVDVEVTEPVVPWTGHDVRIELANVGEGPAVEPIALDARVCPQEPSPTPGCQPLDVPGEVEMSDDEPTVVATTWDGEGSVGAFDVCAELGYDVLQETEANDERCTSTFAVTAVGAGGGVQTA